MSLEYHMECFRESNIQEATFRMNKAEDQFAPAAKTTWQQQEH